MKEQTPQPSKLIKPLSKIGRPNVVLVVIAVLVVLSGVGTGYLLSGITGNGGFGSSAGVAPGAKSGKVEAGLSEEKTPNADRATGKLENGGIEGEGTHHLARDGGETQNVYLTSSVVDLDDFVGKKVDVWGETNKGQKAGWLMDVVRLKVVE